MTIYRFDQITENSRVPVMPGGTESLKIGRWGSLDEMIGPNLHFWKCDIIYGRRCGRRHEHPY